MIFCKIVIFILAVVFFIPNVVLASGGGPLLLIVNSSVFIIGQIWIVGIEFIIFRRMVMLPKQEAFWDVFITNIYSTIAISFGLSIILAIFGLAGNFLPGDAGEFIPAIGTWVYGNAKYSKLAVFSTMFWFVLQYMITIFFEAWIYKRRWIKRNFIPNIKPNILCLYTNTVSHVGLLVAAVAIWHELWPIGN